MVYEIHTYGGGEGLFFILNGIKMIFGSSAYVTLIRIVSVAGILFAVGYTAISQRITPHYFMAWALAYLMLFTPKADVAIVDHIKPAGNQVITRVPASLAVISSYSSWVGDALTRLMEQAYSLPPEIGSRSSGNGTAISLIQSTLHERIAEPYVSASAPQYIRNCVFYDVLDGTRPASAILKSPNLLADFEVVHPSRFTETLIDEDGTEITGHPDVVTCTEGYRRLRLGLGTIYPAWWERFARNVAGSAGVPPETVGSVLPLSYESLMNLAATPQEILFQSAMIHAYDEALELQAKLTGSSTELLGMILSQAEYQQTNAWFTAGQMAREYLPAMRNLAEIFIHGLFVVILLLAFTPLFPAVLKMFGVGFLWLQLWGPILSIINFQVALWTREALLSTDQVTIMTLYQIDSALAGKLALAWGMSAAAVTIAWWIANFSFNGVASAIASAAGVSQSAAGQAASTSGMGNISMGNVHLSSMTANKENTAVERTAGWREERHGGWMEGGYGPAAYTNITPWTEEGAVRATLSNVGGALNLKVDDTDTQLRKTAYNDSKQQVQEMFGSEAAQFRQTLARQSEQQASSGTEQGYGESIESGQSAQWQRTNRAADRVANQIAEKYGVSADTAREIAEEALFTKAISGELGFDGSLGLHAPGIGGAGIKGKVEGTLGGQKRGEESSGIQAKRQHAFDEALNSFTAQESEEAWSLHEQARQSEQARHVQSTSTGGRESTTAGSARESQSLQGFREGVASLNSLAHEISQAEGRSIVLSQDQIPGFINYIGKQGGEQESFVVRKVIDAAREGRVDDTHIAGKTVADWIREYKTDLDRKHLAGPERAELFGKGSSLERGVDARIKGDKDMTSREQGQIRSWVEDRQTVTRDQIEGGKSNVSSKREGVEQKVEDTRGKAGAEVESGKAGISEKQGKISQGGEALKERVEKFQDQGVNLNRVAGEAVIPDFVKEKLNLQWMEGVGSQLSQGRRELFPEGANVPHPNFYGGGPSKEILDRAQQHPEKTLEMIDQQREEMYKNLESVYRTIEKMDHVGKEEER
ncbi:conjugal transfer protein TraG N-terminal domain-containing protein [Candidatus Manganitrophus noduliformans]|uniref:Conjugal transfer protein TraG n=1 Tax=Candidatus Manganitrophus noduliformans TaxID=2606439 RepID=A0A7X6DT06_9BACT|nr:conjugal transfer protein TraG N-terminal domain-containing protein [Candidatus Manganitrophus noduliformans]NKE72852.1 conjugal transfer protein TraG [Candidatus Manganitrophus noduliformans]